MVRVSDKLKGRLKGVRTFPVGISADDVTQLELTPDLVEDLLSSLASADIVDQQIALLFAEVLIWPGKIDETQESALLARITELGCGPPNRVQSYALKLLARYRARVPDFRSLMMNGLKSADPMVRKEALVAYETYCMPNEVVPLESFEHDNYATEIAMSGPQVYELRNLALETIEHVIRKSFRKGEKAESKPDGVVIYWWDWAPYHTWKNSFFRKLF